MDIPSALRFQKQSKHFQTSNDPKQWSLAIKQHANSKDDRAILTTFTQMEFLNIWPDKATLPLVLKACARLSDVERGKKIHRRLTDSGSVGDLRVGTALVDFYAKSGLIENAREVFDEMAQRDVVCWNAMLFGYVGCRFLEKAVSVFVQMQREGLRPNPRTIVGLLSALKETRDPRFGLEIHGYCLRNGMFDFDPHAGTALIGFYSRLDPRASRVVFDSMAVKNVVSWNAVITACVDTGDYSEACGLFLSLVQNGAEFDSVTLLAVIQACEELGFLDLGMQIHQVALKSGHRNDLFVANALLNMYSECGNLDSALRLFENVSDCDLALWNSTIDAYIKHGVHDEAVSLFARLREKGFRENERTIAIMLTSCPYLTDGLRKGETLHGLVVKSAMEIDVSLGNAFLGMYADLNCVKSVRTVFDQMTGLDVVSWNTAIMAFASNGLSDEAWSLFDAMRDSNTEPNSHTAISVLASCHDETCLGIGRALHGFVVKRGIEIDSSLNTALTEMYMNCGDEATGSNLFESFPCKDAVSWNALMSSHVKNRRDDKARSLFRRMVSEAEPNSVAIVNMVSSCTNTSALFEGQSLHAYVTKRKHRFGNDSSLGNALVTMYAKCGDIKYAERVFFELSPKRDVTSWNALITGYASHGLGDYAVLAFSKMLEDGHRPNSATFVAILSACRHCGYVEKGLRFFRSMDRDFKVKPETVHYGCAVDLLCRGGRLSEAREFIESMPIEPDASLWRALLGACNRVGSDTELATTVFEKLVELEPTNTGNYVLVSNIYASAGLWREVREIRATIQEKGLRKSPGKSWIVVRNQVHCFTASDTTHSQSEMIYEILNSLMALSRESGYIPDFHFVSYDEVD